MIRPFFAESSPGSSWQAISTSSDRMHAKMKIMNRPSRVFALLVIGAGLMAGCVSTPEAAPRHALVRCESGDASMCRELATMLTVGAIARADMPEAEAAVLNACRGGQLVDARQGTDVRWRLCYEAGKYFSARASSATEEPGTRLRRIAAQLYRRSCELGQPQACRALLSECLVLDGELCRTAPTQEQASEWADQRRERDARAHSGAR